MRGKVLNPEGYSMAGLHRNGPSHCQRSVSQSYRIQTLNWPNFLQVQQDDIVLFVRGVLEQTHLLPLLHLVRATPPFLSCLHSNDQKENLSWKHNSLQTYNPVNRQGNH